MRISIALIAGIIFLLPIVGGGGNANAQGSLVGPSTVHLLGKDYWPHRKEITEEDFFDFEFARQAFVNLKSYSDLDNGLNDDYQKWIKSLTAITFSFPHLHFVYETFSKSLRGQPDGNDYTLAGSKKNQDKWTTALKWVDLELNKAKTEGAVLDN